MLSRFILFLRHAVALIREDKLFSAIYIAGTAVAIASAMVVALILHIRMGNIYPEEHRDRTVYLKSYFKNDKLFAPGRRGDVQPPEVCRGGQRQRERRVHLSLQRL